MSDASKHQPACARALAPTWLASKGLTGWLLCQQLLCPTDHLERGWLEAAEADQGCGLSTLTGHHHQAEPMLPLENCLDNPGPHRLVQFSGMLHKKVQLLQCGLY